MRVPLAAMVEVEYPTRGPGYLDLARANDALRGAIKLYLTDNIELFENGEPSPSPSVANFRVSLPSDKSFGSYETALAYVQGAPLPSSMDLYWNQPDPIGPLGIRPSPARRPARSYGHDNASLPDTRRRNAGI
jgi:hypothetical protein